MALEYNTFVIGRVVVEGSHITEKKNSRGALNDPDGCTEEDIADIVSELNEVGPNIERMQDRVLVDGEYESTSMEGKSYKCILNTNRGPYPVLVINPRAKCLHRGCQISLIEGGPYHCAQCLSDYCCQEHLELDRTRHETNYCQFLSTFINMFN